MTAPNWAVCLILGEFSHLKISASCSLIGTPIFSIGLTMTYSPSCSSSLPVLKMLQANSSTSIGIPSAFSVICLTSLSGSDLPWVTPLIISFTRCRVFSAIIISLTAAAPSSHAARFGVSPVTVCSWDTPPPIK
ncbi:MAG: hypothetical protein ACI8P9_002392 [Parasphingorhabdus sp.]|jgi:hypothetical protein